MTNSSIYVAKIYGRYQGVVESRKRLRINMRDRSEVIEGLRHILDERFVASAC